MTEKAEPKTVHEFYRQMQTDTDTDDCIKHFLHCAECIKEMPKGVSPKEWSQTQTGWTVRGIQVWCNRHNSNVLHMDFEGAKHPAVTHRKPKDEDFKKIFSQPDEPLEKREKPSEIQMELLWERSKNDTYRRLKFTAQRSPAQATLEVLPQLCAEVLEAAAQEAAPDEKKQVLRKFCDEMTERLMQAAKSESTS